MNSKGPFGLFMGMKIEDFTQSLEELAPFKFMLKNPPRPHPAFNNYLVQVTPKAGLSWIKAIGPGIKTNDYGFALADAFKEMEAKLTKTYSRCRQNDFLLPDSIWNEPKDWMTALEKKERVLASIWDREAQSMLPEAIESIYLLAHAEETDSGYLTLEYHLKNHEESEAEISEVIDDVL
ncbi:hypothetical protein EV673_1707 [Limnobacter thiooxidans]|uniref:Uncharacterized protein n=1 Tax=Limnobacter thiooxidans TaxID=131080 RepID=A0AA86J9E8_9BURK|nr:hypothetical protein EV673_1707 [Limnobacter thiooxidans]BET27620.1 hypothetical protein RGQ30_31210 [Limnobacter thiooxidans]